MVVLLMSLSALSIIVCFLCLALLYDTDQKNGAVLTKTGFRLVLNAGFLLLGLRYLVIVANGKAISDIICDELVESQQFDKLELFGCSIEQMYSIDWSVFLTTAVAEGLSWIVPFVFAAVGVNAISQGLISSTPKEPIVESFINRRGKRMQKILRFLL